MERNLQKNGLINLLTLLVVGVAGFAVARFANSLGGLVSIVFLGVGFLVAAVSWFQMRLEESERLERLELDELAKGHARAALFESKDSEMFPAPTLARAIRAILCSDIYRGAVHWPGRGCFLSLAITLATGC